MDSAGRVKNKRTCYRYGTLKILESEQVDECYMHLEADGYVGDLY